MTQIHTIAHLLERVAGLCCIEFQVHRNGKPIIATRSFCAGVDASHTQSVIARFAPHAEPFQIELQPDGATICGMPLDKTQGTRNWLIALVPAHGQDRMDQDVMPLLRSLIKILKDRSADKDEIDELAVALDHSFEELALYRRLQKSFGTGTLSFSGLSDTLARIRGLVNADVVSIHFPADPDRNITICGPDPHEGMDIHAFVHDLNTHIVKVGTTDENNYISLHNASCDPVFSSISKHPFRLMAARSVFNDHTYGWLGALSFNLNASFNRSHLNMLQAAATNAAILAANNHLLGGLEGLTAQVNAFKHNLTLGPGKSLTRTDARGRQTGDFLEESFNQLSQSIEATKTLMMRSTQMATLGQMAAVFAHEIKQPVCVLDGLIQIAQLKGTGPGQADGYQGMAKSVRRINRIIKRFESFARPNEQRMAPVQFNRIAWEVYQFVKPQLEANNIEGSFVRTAGLPEIMGDAQSLQQAVLNLVSNAIQSMESNNGQGSELQLRTYYQDHQVCLEVIDNGQGIPEALMDKIIEPYFTTQPPDKGTGLGLSVVTDIVEQHSGRLDIKSWPGNGSRFTIKIPAHIEK